VETRTPLDQFAADYGMSIAEAASLVMGSTEQVSKHIYTLVLTTDNVHQGDKDSGYVPYWIIPISEPYDSVQVTVTAQMGPDMPIMIITEYVMLVKGGVAVFRLTGRVEAGCQLRVLVIDMRYKIVAEHNQGGSW
jgi:hypothetical protein